jgi:uroporphyrinogen-III synthase
MIPRDLHVITTRHASRREREAAEKQGVILHEMPLTRILLIDPPSDQLRLVLKQPLPWVFSSRNGVDGCREALTGTASGIPLTMPTRIYAIGPGTAEDADFGGIPVFIPDRFDATGLAEKILKDAEVTEVVHWCGVRRRPELRSLLNDADVHVNEILVYDTLVEKDATLPGITPGAVLFYSPGAVDALMKMQPVPQWDCPLIAIGETTAENLRLAGFKNIFTAASPSPDTMMEMALQLNEVSDV